MQEQRVKPARQFDTMLIGIKGHIYQQLTNKKLFITIFYKDTCYLTLDSGVV